MRRGEVRRGEVRRSELGGDEGWGGDKREARRSEAKRVEPGGCKGRPGEARAGWGVPGHPGQGRLPGRGSRGSRARRTPCRLPRGYRCGRIRTRFGLNRLGQAVWAQQVWPTWMCLNAVRACMTARMRVWVRAHVRTTTLQKNCECGVSEDASVVVVRV